MSKAFYIMSWFFFAIGTIGFMIIAFGDPNMLPKPTGQALTDTQAIQIAKHLEECLNVAMAFIVGLVLNAMGFFFKNAS